MKNYRLLHHITTVTNGTKIWYYADLSGYVMEIDISSGEMECLFAVPMSNKATLYRGLYYYGNKLYILPYEAKILYVYSLTDHKLESVHLSDEDGSNGYITGGIYREGYIYFYGKNPRVCIYNTENMTTKWVDISENILRVDKAEACFWTESFLYKDDIYLLVKYNGLIKIDRNNTVTYISLGTGHENWILRNVEIVDDEILAFYSDKFYITKCSIYDLKGNSISDYQVLVPYAWDMYPYFRARYLSGRWVVFPFRNKSIILIDSHSGEIKGESIICESNIVKDMYYFSDVMKIDETTILALNQYEGEIVIVDSATNDPIRRKVIFTEEGQKRFNRIVMQKIFTQKDIEYESGDEIGVGTLINGLAQEV